MYITYTNKTHSIHLDNGGLLSKGKMILGDDTCLFSDTLRCCSACGSILVRSFMTYNMYTIVYTT